MAPRPSTRRRTGNRRLLLWRPGHGPHRDFFPAFHMPAAGEWLVWSARPRSLEGEWFSALSVWQALLQPLMRPLPEGDKSAEASPYSYGPAGSVICLNMPLLARRVQRVRECAALWPQGGCGADVSVLLNTCQAARLASPGPIAGRASQADEIGAFDWLERDCRP